MENPYRIILQIKAPEGYTFFLWDKSKKIFSGMPREGTKIPQAEVSAEEIEAKKCAEKIVAGSKLDFMVRMEPWPEKFELIEAKGC